MVWERKVFLEVWVWSILTVFMVCRTKKIVFLRSVQFYHLIFISMERVHCIRESIVAQIGPSNRPLWKWCDQEGQGGHEHCLRGSRSYEEALGREARVSQLDAEGGNNSSLSIEPGRSIGTAFMGTWIDVSMDSLFARVVLRNGFIVSKYSDEAERDPSLKNWIFIRWNTRS